MGFGGVANDVQADQATEDREIVGVQWSKDTGAGIAELAFSSSNSTLGGNTDDSTKAQTVASCGNFGGAVWFGDDPISWDSGEELHLHRRNNTGANIFFTATVYYREV